MLSDIAEGGSAEHRVHQGMQGDVRVAVAEEAQPVRNFNPAENQLPVFREPVDIIP